MKEEMISLTICHISLQAGWSGSTLLPLLQAPNMLQEPGTVTSKDRVTLQEDLMPNLQVWKFDQNYFIAIL